MRRIVWPKEEPTEWEDAIRSFAVINEIHGSWKRPDTLYRSLKVTYRRNYGISKISIRWRYDGEETITNRR